MIILVVFNRVRDTANCYLYFEMLFLFCYDKFLHSTSFRIFNG